MPQAKPRRSRSSSTSSTSPAPSGEANAQPLVPSRRQYLELKEAHPEAILLYRLGDFYESFDEDAKTVARDARITLTSRNFGRNGRVPMAGIPHHALNHYLGRLLAAGHTIAIAEQVSEPGKGLVEREVTRVLSPGTVADSSLLPSGESRYLAALRAESSRYGLAWVDVSTGEFAVAQFSGPDAEVQLTDTLTRINPAECLVADQFEDEQAMCDAPLPIPGHRTRMERWHFDPNRAARGLCLHFGTRSLAPFGCADLPAAVGAAGAILAYIERTNPRLLRLLTGLRTDAPDTHVGLDAATRRNLELTRSLKTHGSRGSLLGVLDQTRTAMGARALRRLVTQPLRDRATLVYRQEIIAALVGRPIDRAALADTLASIGDLERLVGRIAQGGGTIRDFLELARALGRLPGLLEILRETGETALIAFADDLNPCTNVRAMIEAAVCEDVDGTPTIRSGFWPELDAALAGASETRSWLAGLERSERERTGIKSLKVGFNKVFGYYIEVTRSNLALVPDDYVRKQTVAGGERFVTVPLKEAEAFVLAAEEQIASLEKAALAHLASAIAPATGRLALAANRLALLDALRSLAEVADRHAWTRPELLESGVLEITGGRHPVVEANLAGTAGHDSDTGIVGIAGDAFIPNDCYLGPPGPTVLLVTGPNMGGKSTFLRQTAVIVLLAQIGSFVPALSARIGMVDRIFTRVGAQDDLAGGSSTFMVEMVETATILHQATDRSLLVLDEIGRGTGTADGLAIARAVLEDIHDRLGARTLFATHYLELTGLERDFPRIANVHAAAIEEDGRVIFLYRLRPGPADRAYGVQVARLAGLPPWVAARAESLLASMSGNNYSASAAEANNGREAPASEQTPSDPVPIPIQHHRVQGRRVAESPAPTYQLVFDGFPAGTDAIERLARSLRDLDLTNLTPREALDWLFTEQSRLGLLS